MREVINYTGYACINPQGKLIGKRCYGDIGMYVPCVYLENGFPIRTTLGGFPGVEGTVIPEKERIQRVVYLPWN